MDLLDYWRASRRISAAGLALDQKTLTVGAAALVYLLMNAAVIFGARDCVMGADTVLCQFVKVVAN